MWFTIIFSGPLTVAIIAVLGHAAVRGRAFMSRGERLRCHITAALLGSFSLSFIVARLNPGSPTFGGDFFMMASVAWLVLFPMLYVPRLLVRRLGGLDASVLPPVMPSSPRL